MVLEFRPKGISRSIVGINDLTKKGFRKSGHNPACKLLILFNPRVVFRIGSRHFVDDNEFRWAFECTIFVTHKIMSTQNGKKLRFPQEKLVWSSLIETR